MENKNKPAYPVTVDWDDVQKKTFTTTEKQGLTKREMFAMAAMQGLLNHSNNHWMKNITPEGYAKKAIELADELLKQLEN